MPSGPKVVIDLPFEGRKVEGSWKNRRWKSIPQVGNRMEETITKLINSSNGEFHITAHRLLRKVKENLLTAEQTLRKETDPFYSTISSEMV